MTTTNNSYNDFQQLQNAQADMRKAYANGAVGVLSSGFVWLISTIVSFQYTEKQALWTLLIGGMFIHPLSILLSKLIGLSGAHNKENPLGKLAMESTFFMLMCLPLAYGLSLHKIEWFFQAMLLIIGGRYLTFNTIYGSKIYWIIGAFLGMAAYLLFAQKVSSSISILTGSIIELLFGIFILVTFWKQKKI